MHAWREPTHILCMLVGLTKGFSVETTCYVASVGIAVADADRSCMCSPGHGGLFKMCVTSPQHERNEHRGDPGGGI